MWLGEVCSLGTHLSMMLSGKKVSDAIDWTGTQSGQQDHVPKVEGSNSWHDAWMWVQDFDVAENGQGAWLALAGRCSGVGKLSKHVEKVKTHRALQWHQ